MQSTSLVLIRFCLSAWVGAAVIFVINGVQDVTFQPFDSLTRDQLITLHFPVYYTIAWVLLTGSFISSLILSTKKIWSRNKANLITALIMLSLAISVVDYFWIYTPLESMITPAGSPRPAQFHHYHQASKYINSVNILLALIAAILVNGPLLSRMPTSSDADGSVTNVK
ncbi:hypothetical protein [Gimesia maris]|uniref:hypothetical protein n=1 Tax=Gimesia maris TaxID=122 RepID=UPI0030D7609F|tara:strand:- start:54869 stop:55375 length:507 start_codon:yes stop_codon:yes gene_type:complete